MGFKIPFFPEEASTTAGRIDALLVGLTLVTILFSLIILVAVIWLAVRFRRGHVVRRYSISHKVGLMLEIGWTLIPLGMAMGLYLWSTLVYFQNIHVPKNAMEIFVVGKQWMWKIQQPNGRWENNELHVPLGRPIRLTMISEDVIHDFFVPAFRAKQDVIPGRYTQLWFEATKTGSYHLFCAQYCGTNHSGMVGWVTVMEPAAYQQWLSTGNTSPTLAAEGERLFRLHGCSGCHGMNSSVRAPLLEGIYGKPVAITIPPATQATTVVADDRYIRDSIMLPEKEVAAGYKPIMPTFQGRISEMDLVKIISYIKSLGSSNGATNGGMDPNRTGNVTSDEVRARTGFLPPNAAKLYGSPGGAEATAGGGKPTAAGTGHQPSEAGSTSTQSGSNQRTSTR